MSSLHTVGRPLLLEMLPHPGCRVLPGLGFQLTFPLSVRVSSGLGPRHSPKITYLVIRTSVIALKATCVLTTTKVCLLCHPLSRPVDLDTRLSTQHLFPGLSQMAPPLRPHNKAPTLCPLSSPSFRLLWPTTLELPCDPVFLSHPHPPSNLQASPAGSGSRIRLVLTSPCYHLVQPVNRGQLASNLPQQSVLHVATRVVF